ncbi:hypothetical protein RE6C_02180 [Rhodopirellula europaea 6C]|uniref:Uncharacterized protein n=2 Tax=Rhodopirellula europaea TaxID=1263866 RepID=M2B4G6_9BACT|nr:hypothetical protein RE6C_02180 [Rhodopirellula europaea 6C]
MDDLAVAWPGLLVMQQHSSAIRTGRLPISGSAKTDYHSFESSECEQTTFRLQREKSE